jgi:hypothetical protein
MSNCLGQATKDNTWHLVVSVVTSSMLFDVCFSSIFLDGHKFNCTKVAIQPTFVTCVHDQTYKHVHTYYVGFTMVGR